jgi:hypothetical protein
MLNIGRVKGLVVAGVWTLGVASCAPADPPSPWDLDEIVRELAPDLHHFEGMPSEFSEVEILAWRIDVRPSLRPPPPIPAPDGPGVLPPREDRVETALLWRRRSRGGAPTDWALVQAIRRLAEEPWQRAVIIGHLSAPLPRLRPGETPDGYWHAYQRYDRPPTSRDACDFAAVSFLVDSGWLRRIEGTFRTRAWTRVFGEAPACGFPETPAVTRANAPGTESQPLALRPSRGRMRAIPQSVRAVSAAAAGHARHQCWCD